MISQVLFTSEQPKKNKMAFVGIFSQITLWAASYSACVIYTKTIIHLSVGESGESLVKFMTENPTETYLVRMKQKRGKYSLKSSGMSVILEIARKYVIPLVGCSQYCTGTPAVGKTQSIKH